MSKNQWLMQLAELVADQMRSRLDSSWVLASDRKTKSAQAKDNAYWWIPVCSKKGLGQFEIWISDDSEPQLWYGFSAQKRIMFDLIEAAVSEACGIEAAVEPDDEFDFDVPQSYEASKSEWYCGLYPEHSPPVNKRPGNELARKIADFAISVDCCLQRAGLIELSDEDRRKRIRAEIVVRQGQGSFRRELLAAYNGKCAISGCSTIDLLDAAHIIPFKGVHTNVVGNGLVLRTDIHRLFDLGLVSIDASTLVIGISDKLNGTIYQAYRGNRLKVRPFRKSLEWHMKNIVDFYSKA